jgi:hypothetical protein
MFKQTNQVQTIDVNEWMNKLLAAHDDVRAVEKIRRRLDEKCAAYIDARKNGLEKQTSLYDWYFEAMPSLNDFENWIMDLIDYQMPDAMVEDWQAVCAEYQRIKSEGKQS